MSFLNSIFSKLDSGDWVIGALLGLYRNKLSQVLNSVDSVLCVQLSLAQYRKMKVEDLRLIIENKGLDKCSLSPAIKHSITDTFSHRNEEIEAVLFSSDEASKLKQAIEYIRSKDERLALIVDENIEVFIRAKGASFKGSSHPHFQGVMFIGDGVSDLTIESLAISIVHELAHQELFLINLLDRLVNQNYDFNEIHAPLQGRARPPIGRLHSLWALYRMLQFQNLIGVDNEKHQKLIKENISAFTDGELTEKGNALVKIAKENAA